MASIGSKALARVHFCAHYWHLERMGDPERKTPPDAWLQKLIDAGVAYEGRVVESLRAAVHGFVDARDAGHTLELMRAGAPLIYRATLERDRLVGRPDLLERIEHPSKLGSHAYQPIDIKSHSRVELKDRLQLAAYSVLLEHVQGLAPEYGGIILSGGARELVRLEATVQEVHAALNTVLAVESGDRATAPIRSSECERCEWLKACGRERRERRLSTLIAGTGTRLSRQMAAVGLDTVERVAALTPQSLAGWLEIPLERATAVWEGAQAWVSGRPFVRARPAVPRATDLVIHYDIETFAGCLYLHGTYLVEGDYRASKQVAARHPSEEYEALREFLGFMEGHPQAIVYTWTEYENGELRRLAGKYLDLAPRIERLEARLVDLKELTKRALALPVTSYSIKEVAPAFGFHWRAKDAGGANSEVWYENWLREGDKSLWKKILAYNEDDVLAMEAVLQGLREALAGDAASPGERPL